MEVIDALLPVDEQAMSPRDFRKLLALLQHTFPTLHPTVLRFVRDDDPAIEGAWGVTTLGTRKGDEGKREDIIIIRVAKSLPWPANFLVFLHEYAHAMTWRPEHQENEEHHSPEWGIAEHRLWAWLAGPAKPV